MKMGQGSYLGGSTIIGPGSSWFGQGESGKSKPSKLQRQQATRVAVKKKHKKKSLSAAKIISSPAEAQSRGLTRAEWLARAGSKVTSVEAQIVALKRKLKSLEATLISAQASRAMALKFETVQLSSAKE